MELLHGTAGSRWLGHNWAWQSRRWHLWENMFTKGKNLLRVRGKACEKQHCEQQGEGGDEVLQVPEHRFPYCPWKDTTVVQFYPEGLKPVGGTLCWIKRKMWRRRRSREELLWSDHNLPFLHSPVPLRMEETEWGEKEWRWAWNKKVEVGRRCFGFCFISDHPYLFIC